MPSVRIAKTLTTGFYYLTFTVRNWYYIFDRHNRFQILADSLKYCQQRKRLKIYAYVFMINHMHIIASSPDMIDVFTLFHLVSGKYEVSARTNMPKIIENEAYLLQKMKYIYENPVRRQYVKKPEDWLWSSANPESDIVVESLVFLYEKYSGSSCKLEPAETR